MEVNHNTFIDILSLPEWDDRVSRALKYLELERPTVEKGEVYAYLSSEKFGLDIMFDYDCITSEQKVMEANGNLYVSQITFKENTILTLPFNIIKGNSYDLIVKKIGKDTDTEKEYIDNSCEWELKKDNIPYTLYCIFENEELINLKSSWMRVQLPLSELT